MHRRLPVTWRVRATPYVRVDPEIVDRNIAAMQAFCDARGMALRPHVKTHKSAEIAARQLAAGAVGLSVATVGEAEAFADQVGAAGKDLFVAYPVAADAPRVRGRRRVPLVVGVDSIEGVRRAADCGVAVSVEIDSGLAPARRPAGRGGTRRGGPRGGLRVRGVFTFPGHGYGVGPARVLPRPTRHARCVRRPPACGRRASTTWC